MRKSNGVESHSGDKLSWPWIRPFYRQGKRYVPLSDILPQTTNADPKKRKGAFKKIKDQLTIFPEGYKQSADEVSEKLCEAILDPDEEIREFVFDAFLGIRYWIKTFVSLFIDRVMRALEDPDVSIRLSGQKLCELLLRHHPSYLHLLFKQILPIVQDKVTKKDISHSLDMVQTVSVCLKSVTSISEISSDSNTFTSLKGILSMFPISWKQDPNAGVDLCHFELDMELTKIYLRFPQLLGPTECENYLDFVNYILRSVGGDRMQELVAFVPPFVPDLVSILPTHFQVRLIQAFTVGFQNCCSVSTFKLACIGAIKEILLGGKAGIADMLMGGKAQKTCDQNLLDCLPLLVQELSKCLRLLGCRDMSTSVVILNILFHVWLNGSSVDITEDMQRIIAWLFCSDPEVHNCKRVFLLIPYEMQRLCLDSLKAFSLLEERLLKSIISCCIRSFDKFFLRKTGEVLTMFYESRHMQGGLLSFFFLLLSEYEDYMGSCSFRIRDLYTTLQPLVDATLPALSKDTCIGVALPNLLPDVISRSSRVMNVHTQNAVLRLVSQTDASLASYSDELVAVVSQFIFNHLIKVAHLTKDRSVVQDHFFTPCFAILSSNTEAFGLILDAILDYVGPSLCLKDGAAVAAVMASIFRNDAMRAALPPFEDRIARITSELVTLKSTTSNELDNMPVKKFYNLCRSLQQLI